MERQARHSTGKGDLFAVMTPNRDSGKNEIGDVAAALTTVLFPSNFVQIGKVASLNALSLAKTDIY